MDEQEVQHMVKSKRLVLGTKLVRKKQTSTLSDLPHPCIREGRGFYEPDTACQEQPLALEKNVKRPTYQQEAKQHEHYLPHHVIEDFTCEANPPYE
eukprot:2101903-Amphidinium_carterae.4